MNMFRAFMELDKLNEVTSTADKTRLDYINKLKSIGRNYNFDRFSTKQLQAMWLKELAKEIEAQNKVKVQAAVKSSRKYRYCADCGNTLTDGGYCPACDDGAEDL